MADLGFRRASYRKGCCCSPPNPVLGLSWWWGSFKDGFPTFPLFFLNRKIPIYITCFKDVSSFSVVPRVMMDGEPGVVCYTSLQFCTLGALSSVIDC